MPWDFVKIGPHEKVKIRMLQGVYVGGQTTQPGDIVTVAKADALLVLGQGRAVLHSEPEPVKAEPVAEKAEVVAAPKLEEAESEPADDAIVAEVPRTRSGTGKKK